MRQTSTLNANGTLNVEDLDRTDVKQQAMVVSVQKFKDVMPTDKMNNKSIVKRYASYYTNTNRWDKSSEGTMHLDIWSKVKRLIIWQVVGTLKHIQ